MVSTCMPTRVGRAATWRTLEKSAGFLSKSSGSSSDWFTRVPPGGASPRSAAARSAARVFVRRDCIRSFARVSALSTEPALPKLGFMRSRAMMATASSAVGSVIERPAQRTCGEGV